MFVKLTLTAVLLASAIVSYQALSDVVTNNWVVKLNKPVTHQEARDLFHSSGFSVISQVCITRSSTRHVGYLYVHVVV